jgi:serine acetyltransferase
VLREAVDAAVQAVLASAVPASGRVWKSVQGEPLGQGGGIAGAGDEHHLLIDDVLGIQAVVLNNAVIGRNCLVGAGAVVTEGNEFPDGSPIVGAPAKAVKRLAPEMIERMKKGAATYVERSAFYKSKLVALD